MDVWHDIKLSKAFPESHLYVVIDVGVAEYQYAMFVDPVLNFLNYSGRKGSGPVDTIDFSNEDLVQRLEF